MSEGCLRATYSREGRSAEVVALQGPDAYERLAREGAPDPIDTAGVWITKPGYHSLSEIIRMLIHLLRGG
jgi:hypothetical protein